MTASVSASGHGYNPYRANGKFAPGPHKVKPKSPRAPAAGKTTAQRKPKAEKFDPAPHKKLIAAHKAVEAHHRGESRRLAGEMRGLKEQAKSAKPRSAERASLKAQHAELSGQRRGHQAKANVAKSERATATAAMRDAKAAHAAKAADPARGGKKSGPEKSKPEPKPEPEYDSAQPHELIWHDSVRAVEAAARGDLQSVHKIMDTQVAEVYGLSRTTGETERGKVTTKPDAELIALGMGGYRNWNGEIVLLESARAKIEKFGRSLGNRQISDALKTHTAKRDKFLDAADELAIKAYKAKTHEAKDQLRKKEYEMRAISHQAHEEVSKLTHGALEMHTMMHETLHGFSPLNSSAYNKHGAQIEEVTTEVAARVVMNHAYGANMRESNQGAYSQQIHAVTNAIAEASGKSHNQAYTHLMAASLEFKRRSGRSIHSSDAARDTFTLDIAKAIGRKASEVGPILQKHLDLAPIARTS